MNTTLIAHDSKGLLGDLLPRGCSVIHYDVGLDPKRKHMRLQASLRAQKAKSGADLGGGNLEDEDDEEDMSDGELMEMFTEIFSIILLKKRRKYLKLKHHDKEASLPHPSSLLIRNPGRGGGIAKKRELKRQIKLE